MIYIKINLINSRESQLTKYQFDLPLLKYI